MTKTQQQGQKRPDHLFRAMWPIIDAHTPLDELLTLAAADLPTVASRARAAVEQAGRWTVCPSTRVPGSGCVTELVLIYEAPATCRDVRPTCGRCKAEVFALVADSDLCLTCDASIDVHLPEEGDAA